MPEPVDVLVLGRLGDRFDFLPQPAVDDMKPGVAQPAGDNFDSAVVAIEPDFGKQNPLRCISFVHGSLTMRPTGGTGRKLRQARPYIPEPWPDCRQHSSSAGMTLSPACCGPA